MHTLRYQCIRGIANICVFNGEAVRVASFRPLFSPKSVRSGYESANSFFKKACFQKRGVPRRFLSHQFRGNGPIKDAGNSIVSVQAGLRYQLEEIVSSPHSEIKISGVCDRYDPTDDLSPTREGPQDHSSVYVSIGELASLIGKLQNASTAILPAPLHYRFMQMSMERHICYQSRPTVGCGHNNGCQPFRLVGRMSGDHDSGSVVRGGDDTTHQCSRVDGSGAGPKVIHTSVAGQSCPFQIEQHDCCVTDFENGISQVVEVYSCHPGDLGTRVIAQEHSYCTTLTGQGKRDCQSAKQGVQGHQQLEAGPSSVCSSDEFLSSHSGGSFFTDRLNHKLAWYWSWRPDPHAEEVDALTTVWNPMRAYAFPPFRLVRRILRKVQDERSELLLVAPVWG